MAIIHVVLFQFKPEIEASAATSVCTMLEDLTHKCIHPKTGKPYVKSHGLGRDNSPEGVQGGLTHGFVFEFESEADRNYYVHEDPAHLAAKAKLIEVMADARVVDFAPGVI